ncbi:ABC transporter substrate-binding protein [Actinomadura livida]|uniref:ABC transporter substrate-binding protein n=1 Tax=Actinomadura livida TaxID=79909 RepID=A0A7W7ICS0_9ACTN|nr:MULTISPECIES: ABC transporter substrate-binding protein [Actinomadura]MBB4774722.1 peptide/nickel transport system substrate-binding protein [Actinomadura catellatispora]GGU06420.1 ABC transporter substrate-binding protein [Actinomadura livida]
MIRRIHFKSGRPWSPAALLVAITVLAAAACSPGNTAAAKKDSIEYLSVVQADVPALDPAQGSTSGQTSGPLWIALYDTLVNITPDGRIEPRLANEVTSNDDATVWTVKLRPGLTFADDTPLNGEAVAAHWRRLAEPEVASPAQGDAAALKDIKVADDQTVVVTLDEADAHWPTRLASSALALIPSPAAVKQHGKQYGTSPETTVGAGPFRVKSWQRDDRVVLVRNEDYWNSAQVALKEIVYRIMPDPSLRSKTFASGTGDVNAVQTAGDDLVKLRKEHDETAWESVGGLSIAFNVRDGHPTSSRTLREALVAAVDIEPTLQRAVPGAEPVRSLFIDSSPFSAPVEMPFGDKARAQELVDGYLAESGKSSVSLTWVVNQQFSTFAQAFKQEWDKIKGLDVRIEVVQSVLDRNRSRDFDLTMSGFGGGTPRVLVDLLLSTEKATNLTGISDSELDDALGRYLTADGREAQRASLEQVQKRLVAELPYLWAHRLIASYFARDGISGLKILTDGSLDFASLKAGE